MGGGGVEEGEPLGGTGRKAEGELEPLALILLHTAAAADRQWRRKRLSVLPRHANRLPPHLLPPRCAQPDDASRRGRRLAISRSSLNFLRLLSGGRFIGPFSVAWLLRLDAGVAGGGGASVSIRSATIHTYTRVASNPEEEERMKEVAEQVVRWQKVGG